MLTFTGGTGRPVLSFLLYHTGRLLVYGFIGLMFGVLSSSLFFFHLQQTGSIVLGFLIIVIYALPSFRQRVEGWYYHSSFYKLAKSKLMSFYGGGLRWLAAGVLNGLLPCGMIYLAAAGALLSGALWSSVVFMVVFGLGTLPALITVAYISGRLPVLMGRLSYAITPIALLSGGLLVFRGFTVQNPDLNSLIQAHIANVVSACGF